MRGVGKGARHDAEQGPQYQGGEGGPCPGLEVLISVSLAQACTRLQAHFGGTECWWGAALD